MQAPKCGGCGKLVLPMDRPVTFLDKEWHQNCLRCTTCATKLGERNLEEFEGKPYCRTHWPQSSKLLASIYLENQSKYIKSTHKVVLYVDARHANVYSIRRTMTIIEFFGKKGIEEKDILMINVSDDIGRVKWLKEQNPHGGTLEYPQIFIGDVRIGTLNHLMNEDSLGRIDAILRENKTSSLSLSISADQPPEFEPVQEEEGAEGEKPKSGSGKGLSPVSAAHHHLHPPSASSMQLGYVDTWLNGAEWVLKGLVGGVWNASSYLIGARKGSDAVPAPAAQPASPIVEKDKSAPVSPSASSSENAPAPSELPRNMSSAGIAVAESGDTVIIPHARADSPAEPDQSMQLTAPRGAKAPPKTQGTFEFEAIRTNWYWRHQRRLYRFTSEGWMRIEPVSMIIKDTFAYDDVKDINHTDSVNMIITFHSGKEPQYIRSVHNDEITRLIQDRHSHPENIKIHLPSK